MLSLVAQLLPSIPKRDVDYAAWLVRNRLGSKLMLQITSFQRTISAAIELKIGSVRVTTVNLTEVKLLIVASLFVCVENLASVRDMNKRISSYESTAKFEVI